jgi:hypothetical protein
MERRKFELKRRMARRKKHPTLQDQPELPIEVIL